MAWRECRHILSIRQRSVMNSTGQLASGLGSSCQVPYVTDDGQKPWDSLIMVRANGLSDQGGVGLLSFSVGLLKSCIERRDLIDYRPLGMRTTFIAVSD